MWTSLACPNCKELLLDQILDGQQFLSCSTCQLLTPVVNDFVLFTETGAVGGYSTRGVQALREKFSDTKGYEAYCRAKYQRGVIEIYAAFQPFNESSRAIYPFIDQLKGQLQPGDLIIDTWSRTGWSALLLAALFPEQRVVAIWEGDNSVLGYAGYGYWFSPERRPENLSVIFLAPGQDLPFLDGSAALIHGHDIVHRRPMPSYLDDLLRVGTPNGAILLPHIHLSNSEPDPYFQRGGQLRHSREYRDYLVHRLVGEKRQAMVLSEPDLFDQDHPLNLTDATECKDYNGMIVVDTGLSQRLLTGNWLQLFCDDARVLVNPLLLVCPFTGTVLFNEEGLGDQLDYLLRRHPIYEKRLKKISQLSVSTLQYQLLRLADQGKTLAVMALKLGVGLSQVKDALLRLCEYEVITVLPISQNAVELQNFHNNQHRITGISFVLAWQNLITSQPRRVVMTLEGEYLSAEELAQLVDGWRRYLCLRTDIDSLNLSCQDELLVPLVMACWLEGVCVTRELSDDEVDVTVVTHSVHGGAQEISLKDGSNNSYWTVLEPFIGDSPLPLSRNKTRAAVVDDLSWEQWLEPLILDYLPATYSRHLKISGISLS